jgi:hypothetical protein
MGYDQKLGFRSRPVRHNRVRGQLDLQHTALNTERRDAIAVDKGRGR